MLTSDLSPCLYNGITRAIFHQLGNIPELILKLKMWTSGSKITPAILFNKFVDNSSYPTELPFFKFLIILWNSAKLTGARNMLVHSLGVNILYATCKGTNLFLLKQSNHSKHIESSFFLFDFINSTVQIFNCKLRQDVSFSIFSIFDSLLTISFLRTECSLSRLSTLISS